MSVKGSTHSDKRTLALDYFLEIAAAQRPAAFQLPSATQAKLDRWLAARPAHRLNHLPRKS